MHLMVTGSNPVTDLLSYDGNHAADILGLPCR